MNKILTLVFTFIFLIISNAYGDTYKEQVQREYNERMQRQEEFNNQQEAKRKEVAEEKERQRLDKIKQMEIMQSEERVKQIQKAESEKGTLREKFQQESKRRNEDAQKQINDARRAKTTTCRNKDGKDGQYLVFIDNKVLNYYLNKDYGPPNLKDGMNLNQMQIYERKNNTIIFDSAALFELYLDTYELIRKDRGGSLTSYQCNRINL
jgi:cell division protein FtsL